LEYRRRARRQQERPTPQDLHTFKVFASGSAGKSGSEQSRLGSDCSQCSCCYRTVRVTVSLARALHLLTETNIISAISLLFTSICRLLYTSRPAAIDERRFQYLRHSSVMTFQMNNTNTIQRQMLENNEHTKHVHDFHCRHTTALQLRKLCSIMTLSRYLCLAVTSFAHVQ